MLFLKGQMATFGFGKGRQNGTIWPGMPHGFRFPGAARNAARGRPKLKF